MPASNLATVQEARIDLDRAIRREFELGMRSLASAELAGGLGRFRTGQGRHGSFEN